MQNATTGVSHEYAPTLATPATSGYPTRTNPARSSLRRPHNALFAVSASAIGHRGTTQGTRSRGHVVPSCPPISRVDTSTTHKRAQLVPMTSLLADALREDPIAPGLRAHRRQEPDQRRGSSAAKPATTCLTCWLCVREQTITASAVSTTTMSSSPTIATARPA